MPGFPTKTRITLNTFMPACNDAAICCVIASAWSTTTATTGARSWSRGRTVLVADTAVHDMPSSEELADIAEEAAHVARRLGYEPCVAILAFSTFGHPASERAERVREALQILDKRRIDFEYDGEMAADVALNIDAMAAYPFCRLSGLANVLIMPTFHAAPISTKMVQELGGSTIIGPLLVGLDKPVQIVPMSSKDSDIINMAAVAAYNVT